MKEKMTKVFNQITVNKAFMAIAVFLMVAFGACVMPACAAGTGADAVGVLIGYVLKIFQYVGMLLLVWAIAQLVLAFKNEDADSKSRAMMMLMVGVLLCVIKPVVEAVIKALNLDIKINDSVNF